MKYKPYKIPEVFKIQGLELPGLGFFDRKGRFIPRLPEEVAWMGPAMDPELADKLAEEDPEGTIPYTLKLRPDSRHDMAWAALPEIDEIWWAIKSVGPIARTNTKYKKDAALTRFDDSKQGFELIKREYLEDDNLYEFNSPTQEKRDFTLRLLRKIFKGRVKVKTTNDQLLYLIWLIRREKEEPAFDMSYTDTE